MKTKSKKQNRFNPHGISWIKICDECGCTSYVKAKYCEMCESQRLVLLYRDVEHEPTCAGIVGHTCDCKGRVTYHGSRRMYL